MTLSESANIDCAFCKIVGGEEASHVVFEDDVCMAFLDRRPLFWGHLLLIPKAHYETLADLPPELVGPFFVDAQLLAQTVEQATQAQGSFLAINNRVSQSVPHLHIHIVPRNRKDGLKGFFWPRTKYRDEDHMLQVRDALRNTIAKLQSK